MGLDEAAQNIGRKVVYTPYDGCPLEQKEEGVITSVNHKYVFVRYGSDVNSKATDAEDIALL